jgi:hypothetical protein
MKKVKQLSRALAGLWLVALTLGMVGCGNDTTTPIITAPITKTTTAGSVTIDGTQQTVASPSAATITIPAGSALTDTNGLAVTGSQTTTVSYSTKAADLPAAAATLPAGATMAAMLDITIGTAVNFSTPLSIVLNVTPAAAVGDTVVIYSFNTTSNTWEVSDTLTVAANGTVSFTARHLSIWAAFKTATPPPGKPKGVSATAGNGQVTVTWAAPTLGTPTAYNIYHATTAGVTPGATGVTKIALATAATSAVIKPLTNGTTYYFVVTAVNANGEGGVSSEKSIAPDAALQVPASPTGVSVLPGTVSGTVTATWATVPNATTYNIFYLAGVIGEKTTPGATIPVSGTKVVVQADSAITPPSPQTFTVTGLISGTSYGFVITAENSAGESTTQTWAKPATPP